MFLRFDAALNDKNFSEIAPELVLTDIAEDPAEVDVQGYRRGYRPGRRISNRVRLSLSVRLTYIIRAYDISRRAEIRDMVADWAKEGGWLTINSRPGKRLYVKADTPPALDSSLKWTQALTMTLTAYEQPYWEDAEDVQTEAATSTWSNTYQQYYTARTITPTGNLPHVPLEVSFFVAGDEPLTQIKIVADDTFIELKGMTVEPGLISGFVFIEHDEDDLLKIYDLMADDENSSLLRYRTAESSDDLLVRCGKSNQIHVYADAPVTVSFWARGRWV